jgi:hypothetical protein
MRRTLLALSLALAATGALAAPSVAGSGAFADPAGDVFDGPQRGSLDIVRTSYGHSGSRITHTVGLAANAPNPSSQPVPRLYINIAGRANGTSECAVFVGRHKGRLGVFSCGYADRVGSARIERTSSKTIRYTFSASAIGNPRSYDWAAVTSTGSSERNSAVRADRAPSADQSFYTHALR